MSLMDEAWIQILNDDVGQPRIQTTHIKLITREYVNNKDLSELSALEYSNKIPSLLNGECPNCKKSVFRSFEGQADYGSGSGRVETEFYGVDEINIVCPKCHTNIEIHDKYFTYLVNYACANGERVYLNALTSDYRIKLKEKRKEELKNPISVKELLSKNVNMNKYENLLLKVKDSLINSKEISNGCIKFNINEAYSNEDINRLKNFYNVDTGFKKIEVESLDSATNFKFYYE